MYVFKVLQEHQSLPQDEVKAVCATYPGMHSFSERGDYIVAEGTIDSSGLQKRLALCHEFFRVIAKSREENMLPLLEDSSNKNKFTHSANSHIFTGCKSIPSPSKNTTFAVRAHGFSDNRKVERGAGAALEKSGAKVDLQNPGREYYLIKLSDEVFICDKRFVIDKKQFSDRDPRKRPFFHPTALKPKLARAFVNLSRARSDDRILDPFCGSGSIVIEARLMGLDCYGSDMDGKMLSGCRENLEHFGLEAELFEGDATEISLEDLDAIVTDPPYARSAKVFSTDLHQLYDSFLSSSSDALKKKGRLVFAAPSEQGIFPKKHGFNKVADYDIYVHKSLTRRVHVLQKL